MESFYLKKSMQFSFINQRLNVAFLYFRMIFFVKFFYFHFSIFQILAVKNLVLQKRSHWYLFCAADNFLKVINVNCHIPEYEN